MSVPIESPVSYSNVGITRWWQRSIFASQTAYVTLALLVLLLASSGAFFAGVLGVVVEVGLTLFLLFFFLRDGGEATARAVRLIPLSPERKADLVEIGHNAVPKTNGGNAVGQEVSRR